MREISFWEADDGTRFEFEDECAEYEWRLKVKKHENAFYLLTPNHKILDNLEISSYEDCYYIFLKNSKSGTILRELWDDDHILGCSCPDFLCDWSVEPGLWVYEEDNDYWYHLGERIAELQDMADACMTAINEG